MAQDTKTVFKLARRETFGKKVKALRRDGITPANISGRDVESVAVQMGSEELRILLKSHGKNEIIYVQLDGEERPTFIREISRNPVNDRILHIDFLQIDLKKKVKLEVPIHLTGVAPAVDDHGGIVTHALTRVLVEALPTSIPQFIVVDISGLTDIGQSIHVSDITPPPDTEILQDAESVVARIDLPAAERVEEEEVEGELAEGEEAAEGEEGAEEGAEEGGEGEESSEEGGE